MSATEAPVVVTRESSSATLTPPGKDGTSSSSSSSALKNQQQTLATQRRRVRTPHCTPFAQQLTRCRQCKRSKQGAVFCRVVRSHREDGWVPPEGFEEWLAEWNAETSADERHQLRRRAGTTKRRCAADLWPPARRRRVVEDEDRGRWVWKAGVVEEGALEAYLREVHAPEDVALRALLVADYDMSAAKAALGHTPRPLVPAAMPAEADAVLAVASWIAGRGAPATAPAGVAENKRRLRWSAEDVFRFGEAMLECDRDCRAAWKKLRRRDSFASATTGDVLDLYYGVFKQSGHYADWKERLAWRRRGPSSSGTPPPPQSQGRELQRTATHSSSSDEPALVSSSDSSTSDEKLVFECPCGCGAVVDNRGRPSSHRRKWATRSCRDRAARSSQRHTEDEASEEDVADVTPCLCGCGETVDNRGRPSSHRKKWASAACRQRAHSERAKELRRTNRAAGHHRARAAGADGRHALVHAGIMIAITASSKPDDGAARFGRVAGRCDDGWLVEVADGTDAVASAVEIARLGLRDAKPAAPQTEQYRGVTRKAYGDCARYNASFSLLGDRFSLGGYETAYQAARAWDVVAWAAGRDDLNVLTFAHPKPRPTREDLQLLAHALREHMRLRSAPLSSLKHQTIDLDAVTADGEVLCLVDSRTTEKTTTATTKRSFDDEGDDEDECDDNHQHHHQRQRQMPPRRVELLAAERFAPLVGATLVVRGAVYVITARLSRRWLLQRLDGAEPSLLEMTGADVERNGHASFPLLSRGIVGSADSDALDAAIKFLDAQFVGKRVARGLVVTDVEFDASRNLLVARAQSPDGNAPHHLDIFECRRDLARDDRSLLANQRQVPILPALLAS